MKIDKHFDPTDDLERELLQELDDIAKQLRGKSSSDTTTLLGEVNFEFAKTMNKINHKTILKKHRKMTPGGTQNDCNF